MLIRLHGCAGRLLSTLVANISTIFTSRLKVKLFLLRFFLLKLDIINYGEGVAIVFQMAVCIFSRKWGNMPAISSEQLSNFGQFDSLCNHRADFSILCLHYLPEFYQNISKLSAARIGTDRYFPDFFKDKPKSISITNS